MPATFLFEELDSETKGYLTTVRRAGGKGMPGMFAQMTSGFAGCSCIAGLILVPVTLILTLTDAINVVFDDPIGVAFLQTAGLLLGGWLLIASLRDRGARGDAKSAGHWVYMDPLNLYVAYRELVTVTPMEGVAEGHYTHNYQNNKYQNSAVRVTFEDQPPVTFTLTDELRAEQFVVFVNYLSWARGSDGGAARDLPPAQLGAVARFVARHDSEPKKMDGTFDMERVNLLVEEVPEAPSREGRAPPSVLPYVLILVTAVVIFVVMGFIVNPVVRDNALYNAVMQQPTEPRVLRAYLIDPRNTQYRKEVLDELSSHYRKVIQAVLNNAQQPQLRDAMVKILRNLSQEPDQPVVSVRVTERSPEDLARGAGERVKKLREGFVGGDGLTGLNREGVLDVFASVSPPIQPRPGTEFTTPPPPIGHQLIAFVEPPEDAASAHFQITYELKPTGRNDELLLSVTVEIRETLNGQPIATYSQDVSTTAADEKSLAGAIDELRANLVRWMVGPPNRQWGP